jgi:hypothetical protein
VAGARGQHAQPYGVLQQLVHLLGALAEQPLDLERALPPLQGGQLDGHLGDQRGGVAVVADRQQAVGCVQLEVVGRDPVLPGPAPQPAVGDLVRTGAATGDRLEVGEQGVGAVPHLVAGLAQAQAEVDVLVAVAVARVEAADRPEGAAPQQHAGAGDDLERPAAQHRRVVSGEAGVRVVRQPVPPDDDAGVLHGAVQVQQPCADRRGCGVADGAADQRVQPARVRRRVVVEQHHELGPAASTPAPQAAPKPRLTGWLQDVDAVAVGQQELGGVVRGAVVHDQDARAGRQVLRQQHVEAVPGERRPAVHRDDHRDRGRPARPGHAPTSAGRRARSRKAVPDGTSTTCSAVPSR